ncbi:map microtubule affinity-regulating kinase 3, partial [Lynx pardinus]
MEALNHTNTKEARGKFQQLVSTVQYRHQDGTIHKDLKPENLLCGMQLNIKISDFGFSNQFTIGHKWNTYSNSPPYATPELFLCQKVQRSTT